MIPAPGEVDLERLPIVAVTLTGNRDVPKLFWHKGLYPVVLVHDETESRELAGAVTNQLLITQLRDTHLEGLRQESCESGPNAKVQLSTCFDSFGLVLVECPSLPTGLVYLPGGQLGQSIGAHAAMMALNLARLTVICGLDLRQTDSISDPICSPSRSQSVQIIKT